MNSMQIALNAAAAPPPKLALRIRAATPMRVELIDDLAAAEPAWRELEASGAVASAFQRFDWVTAWSRHIAKSDGLRFLIVVARNANGTPQYLLPFVYCPGSSLVIARFPGGEHSNINTGLWRDEAAAALTAAQVTTDLRAAARQRGIDLFLLLQQPVKWQGVANPLASLPHQPTADDVWGVTFPAEVDVLKAILTKSAHKGLRNKTRKLEKSAAGFRYLQASTRSEVDWLLDAFFAQKAAHFAEQGISNVFADPRVCAFIRECCHAQSPDGRRVVELHGLANDDEVIAVIGGVADAQRFSCMFNSYTTSAAGRHSPGLILLSRLVPLCAERGLSGFDLGPGRARYKTVFCREPEGLVDSLIAVSWRGCLAAPALRALRAGKRRVKAHPIWQSLGPTLRRRLGGHAASGCGAAWGASTSTTSSE